MANEIYKANDVQLRQQIQARLNALSAAITAAVSDTAYNEATWNGVTTIAPSKNAVRDQFEFLSSAVKWTPQTGDTTLALGDKLAAFGLASTSKTWTLPSSFTAASASDTKNDIWCWNANAATVFVIKITPASGDTIYRDGASLGADKAYHLQPGEMAILIPIADNASWSIIVLNRKIYTPAMMKYDGSADYYSKASVSTSGNKLTVTGQFRCLPRAGISARWLLVAHNGTLNGRRVNLQIGDTSNASHPEKLAFLCRTASAFICNVVSGTNVTDGLRHTFFLEFDGDAGTNIFNLDGVTTGHTVVASTTGTLNSGSLTFETGYSTIAGGVDYDGMLGYVGYRDVAGLDYSDIFTADGKPLELDEVGWTEWGAQPTIWNPHGQLTNNLGSAGNFTLNGTISPVIQFPNSTGLRL